MRSWASRGVVPASPTGHHFSVQFRELDSMAVVALITNLEERLGFSSIMTKSTMPRLQRSARCWISFRSSSRPDSDALTGILRKNENIYQDPLSLAHFPIHFPANGYLTLYYNSLRNFGFSYVESGYFGQEWLRKNSGVIDYLHFHWVGGYYENLQGENSFPRLAIFLGKIWVARILGFRIIWTAHNLYPHNRKMKYQELDFQIIVCAFRQYCFC